LSGLPAKIFFVCLIVLAGIAIAFRWSVDPMNSHGLGRGWECDSAKGSICAKDLKISGANGRQK
jgi:hypothetical protein